MVLPLLVMALAWDKLRLVGRRIGQARTVRFNLAGHALVTSTVNIAVAAGFAVMGGFIIYLAGVGEMTGGPGFQVAIGRGLASAFRDLLAWTRPVPEPVLGLAVLALAAVFIVATHRDRGRPADPEPEPEPGTTPGQPGSLPPDDPGDGVGHCHTPARSHS